MTVRGKDVMPLPPDVRDAVSRLAEGYRYARGMIQSTQVYSCPAYRVPEWVGGEGRLYGVDPEAR